MVSEKMRRTVPKLKEHTKTQACPSMRQRVQARRQTWQPPSPPATTLREMPR